MGTSNDHVPATADPQSSDIPEDLLAQDYGASIRRFHINDSASLAKHTLVTILFLVLVVGAVWSWSIGWWPLTIALWPLMGYIGHSKVITLHESSHGTLHANPIINEIQGLYVGLLSIVLPLSAYRYVHGLHHAHINSERDGELWPYNNPRAPRWLRCVAAVVELTLGLIWTPIQFIRAVWVGENLSRGQRVRIWAEYAVNVAFWSVAFTIISMQGWWPEFLVGWIIPFALAANLQSLRKFTEHMGMLDSSPLGGSRTVIDERLVGRAISATLLHIDYHGTHHRYGRIPYYYLPAATPLVYRRADPAHAPIFPSYWAAMFDMLRSLGNPRVGSQWLDTPGEPALAQTADQPPAT